MAKEKTFLFVDGDKFDIENSTITGAQLRQLAGIPQGAQIYLKVPSKPDAEVLDSTVIDLVQLHGPAKFSTQSPGSQAG